VKLALVKAIFEWFLLLTGDVEVKVEEDRKPVGWPHLKIPGLLQEEQVGIFTFVLGL